MYEGQGHCQVVIASQPVAYVRDLLVGFAAPWFLCGGWAADAWLGRQTRDHWDVDIGVFHHDQRAIFEHFQGWALVAHDPNVPDATTEPWNGRRLDAPAHVHVPTLGSSLSTVPSATHTAFEFEFLLGEGTEPDWILHRQPHIAVPRERAIRPSPLGLPTATPEVILFFKAVGGIRPHDEQDFHALLPTLGEEQRAWFGESLATAEPDHPWLAQLQAAR